MKRGNNTFTLVAGFVVVHPPKRRAMLVIIRHTELLMNCRDGFLVKGETEDAASQSAVRRSACSGFICRERTVTLTSPVSAGLNGTEDAGFIAKKGPSGAALTAFIR
jgi:hypothetical protein